MARLRSLFRRGNAFALLHPLKRIRQNIRQSIKKRRPIKMPPSDLNHPRRHE
jgi:hypothetical protein